VAYALHIFRFTLDNEDFRLPIALQEWKEAVGSQDSVRLIPYPTRLDLGHGGSMETNDGDAEVFLGEARGWHPVFHWFEDSASFSARALDHDNLASDPIFRAAAAIARRLGAVISGDDGEQYDLDTAAVTPDSEINPD